MSRNRDTLNDNIFSFDFYSSFPHRIFIQFFRGVSPQERVSESEKETVNRVEKKRGKGKKEKRKKELTLKCRVR